MSTKLKTVVQKIYSLWGGGLFCMDINIIKHFVGLNFICQVFCHSSSFSIYHCYVSITVVVVISMQIRQSSANNLNVHSSSFVKSLM